MPKRVPYPPHDRRNPTVAASWYRRRLGRELPSLPPELADRADFLTLAFLAATLLDSEEATDERRVAV